MFVSATQRNHMAVHLVSQAADLLRLLSVRESIVVQRLTTRGTTFRTKIYIYTLSYQ